VGPGAVGSDGISMALYKVASVTRCPNKSSAMRLAESNLNFCPLSCPPSTPPEGRVLATGAVLAGMAPIFRGP